MGKHGFVAAVAVAAAAAAAVCEATNATDLLASSMPCTQQATALTSLVDASVEVLLRLQTLTVTVRAHTWMHYMQTYVSADAYSPNCCAHTQTNTWCVRSPRSFTLSWPLLQVTKLPPAIIDGQLFAIRAACTALVQANGVFPVHPAVSVCMCV